MAEIKTKATDVIPEKYINSIENDQRRADCARLVEIMTEVSGAPAKMWGDSIVGFGDFHYKYASGRENDWFYCGFSNRKQNIVIYSMAYIENFPDTIKNLGKFKTGKACIYINKLDDIKIEVLKQYLSESIEKLKG